MCKIAIIVYEFIKRFPNEDAARKYIENRRWGDSLACPCAKASAFRAWRAGSVFSTKIAAVSLRCAPVRFLSSHIPLDKWLYAMYLIATARKGVSSLQLSKEIGITQKSAWLMLHRLREACKPGGVKHLSRFAMPR